MPGDVDFKIIMQKRENTLKIQTYKKYRNVLNIPANKQRDISKYFFFCPFTGIVGIICVKYVWLLVRCVFGGSWFAFFWKVVAWDRALLLWGSPSLANPRSDTFSRVKLSFTFTPLGSDLSFMASFQK